MTNKNTLVHPSHNICKQVEVCEGGDSVLKECDDASIVDFTEGDNETQTQDEKIRVEMKLKWRMKAVIMNWYPTWQLLLRLKHK